MEEVVRSSVDVKDECIGVALDSAVEVGLSHPVVPQVDVHLDRQGILVVVGDGVLDKQLNFVDEEPVQILYGSQSIANCDPKS